MPNKDKLYVKRYKTLKAHQAAVAARKLLKDGKNRGPVANNDAYGEAIKKPKPAPSTPARPSTPSRPSTPARTSAPSTTSRPSTPSRPTQAPSKPIPSNPELKTQPKPASSTRRGRTTEDPRARGLSNNVKEMEAARRRRDQKAAFTNTGTPARPSKNPKKGDTYKKPFGNVMVYDGTKWVRKK